MTTSSPRTWGCFLRSRIKRLRQHVFPTHVGVFPLIGFWDCGPVGLPHARGGVSVAARCNRQGCWSSPRTWGCFYSRGLLLWPILVFPTHVGVFPGHSGLIPVVHSLPHARGGVSDPAFAATIATESSPRTWGCFWLASYLSRHRLVFPTHVGVFLKKPARLTGWWGLPHARGGVSMARVQHAIEAASSPRTWGCFSSSGRS